MTPRIKLKKPLPWSFQAILERSKAKREERERRYLILYPDNDMVRRHLCANSTFCQAMVRQGYLTWEEMHHAARRYQLGMARDGGVIFWQIDPLNNWQDGKIMYYREDGHRDHHHHPTWVCNELKRYLFGTDNPLYRELTPTHCLFGLHLMREEGNTTVAVVEAEKTAVVMSERFPNYLWVATGGLSELSPEKLHTLRGHRIVLFPDTDEDGTTYRIWYQQAQKAQKMLGQPVHVSPILELHASPDQKRRKIDLVDYLFEASKRPVCGLQTTRM